MDDLGLTAFESTSEFEPPSSPHLPLMSLPNDDFTPLLTLPPDEDFIPPSLLFDDVSPPRSPSPEIPDDIDPADCTEPDLQRLLDMKKQSQAVVRAAKQTEKQMLESGAIQQSAEARRQRKKEKERFKEISQLLRLKLDDSSGRDVVADMALLVAKMFLRRHEAVRPLSNLPLAKRTPWLDFQRKSPLSQSFTLDDES